MIVLRNTHDGVRFFPALPTRSFWNVNHYRIIVLRTRAFIGVVDGISAVQGGFADIVFVRLGLIQNITAFNLYLPSQGCQAIELGSGLLGALRFVFGGGYAQ